MNGIIEACAMIGGLVAFIYFVLTALDWLHAKWQQRRAHSLGLRRFPEFRNYRGG